MTPSWTPALVQTIMTVAVLVGVGLAVFGQVRWRAVQEYEALAEARLQHIQLKEQEITMLRQKVTAHEGLIAEMQRLNLELQRELDHLKRQYQERRSDA